MPRYLSYVKMMSPEESNKLFSVGEHEWNLRHQSHVMFIPARRSQVPEHREMGWKPGMPVPEVYHTLNGIEETIISVEAEDGVVYTGTATRYFDPKRFEDKNHKVFTQFLLGDAQFSLPLDNRMKQLGFDYTANEPTP